MSHNRSKEILGPTFHWPGQTSGGNTENFERCLDTPPQLRAGWEGWGGKSQNDIMDWNPGIYLPGSDHAQLYDTYYPTIIDRESSMRKLVSYNSNRVISAPRDWMNMPPLDFLPPEVDDILSGAGGLLVVNGGTQPRRPNPDIQVIPPLAEGETPTPPPPPPPSPPTNQSAQDAAKPEKEKLLEDFPQQSIFLICNPLTRDVHFMPRHTRFDMTAKTARMVLITNEPEVDDWRKLRPAKRNPAFNLYVLGSHVWSSGSLLPDISMIALFTYDSRVDSWVACSSCRDARIPPHGRTDIAIVADGLYFGGQVSAGKFNTVRRPGGKEENTWVNKIFWVEISLSRWNKIDFVIPDLVQPGKTLCCQAPRVLQCQPQGPIYIVTRPLKKPNVIQVWELQIYSKLPTGRLGLVTTMPPEMFYVMFGRIQSNKAWDCAAGRNYLAFVPAHDIKMTEVVIYEVDKDEWCLSRRPVEPGKIARYGLARG